MAPGCLQHIAVATAASAAGLCLGGFQRVIAWVNQFGGALRFGNRLGHDMPAEDGAADDQRDDYYVGGCGAKSAVLLIVVEAPDIFDRFRLRFQLKRRKLLGKKEFVEAAR